MEILGRKMPLPNEADWERSGFSSYGLLLDNGAGAYCQVEKVPYAIAERLCSGDLALSLGAFSIAPGILRALIDAFSAELSAREGMLNTDPHFWMPLTLEKDLYCELLGSEWAAHWERLASLRSEFSLGALDIGADAFWWDFGQVRHYVSNCLKLTQSTAEGEALRRFFGVERDPATGSCIIGSDVEGEYKDCVVVGSTIGRLDLRDSVAIDSRAPLAEGNSSLLYNVLSDEELKLADGEVRADVQTPSGRLSLYTEQSRDGSKDWTITLPRNSLSFADVYALNQKLSDSQSRL